MFKPAVGDAVVELLRPIREEAGRLMADKAYLEGIYKEGAERASHLAAKTLRKVYKKVGLSYLACPDCGKKIPIFGASHTEQAAQEAGLPLLAQLPIDPDKARLADTGRIGQAEVEDTLCVALDAAEALLNA